MSRQVCPVCEESKGFEYNYIPYGTTELKHICPWCIADGSAHARFGVEFVDRAGIGGFGKWEKIRADIMDDVAFRTPGFAGWQQEEWFTHCGDAAEFLGPMGKTELQQMGTAAVEAIKKEFRGHDAEWDRYFLTLNGESGPTAYLFRCRHCGQFGGYSDCH